METWSQAGFRFHLRLQRLQWPKLVCSLLHQTFLHCLAPFMSVGCVICAQFSPVTLSFWFLSPVFSTVDSLYPDLFGVPAYLPSSGLPSLPNYSPSFGFAVCTWYTNTVSLHLCRKSCCASWLIFILFPDSFLVTVVEKQLFISIKF